jgi:hypothetical protein
VPQFSAAETRVEDINLQLPVGERNKGGGVRQCRARPTIWMLSYSGKLVSMPFPVNPPSSKSASRVFDPELFTAG